MALEQKSFYGNVERLHSPKPEQLAETKVPLSGPLKMDFEVYRGDTARFRITLKNSDSTPFDATGAVWDADIRLNQTSSTPLTKFEITPVVGDPSSIDVFLSGPNSDLLIASCVYDIEMRISEDVITILGGAITVTQDVSRTP